MFTRRWSSLPAANAAWMAGKSSTSCTPCATTRSACGLVHGHTVHTSPAATGTGCNAAYPFGLSGHTSGRWVSSASTVACVACAHATSRSHPATASPSSAALIFDTEVPSNA